jgi:hypothetical protein
LPVFGGPCTAADAQFTVIEGLKNPPARAGGPYSTLSFRSDQQAQGEQRDERET